MQLFRNILIPTDFSQAAWNAVQIGLALADSKGSCITLLHVFPSSAKFTTAKKASANDRSEILNLQLQMDEFCASLERSSAARITPRIAQGKVEPQILHYIDENEFDMVILGVNSNGSDNHPGSHIQNIIENANAPVMVIPNQIIGEAKHKVSA